MNLRLVQTGHHYHDNIMIRETRSEAGRRQAEEVRGPSKGKFCSDGAGTMFEQQGVAAAAHGAG